MANGCGWRIGDWVQTRSGGTPMEFIGWVRDGVARCQIGERTYDLPADILKPIGPDERGSRRGRQPRRIAPALHLTAPSSGTRFGN